jgi:hypothetical protein
MTRLRFAAAALAVLMSAIAPVASQAKAIKSTSGLISADGSVLAGSGFLLVRNGVEDYTITFGKGAFKAAPVVTCTAAGVQTLLAICNISSTILFADGSATIGIRLYARSSGKLEDNNFTFTEITAPQ